MWRVFELASVGYMTGSSRCQVCFFSYLSGYFADLLTYVMECRSSSQTFRSSGFLLLCCVLLETCNDYHPSQIHPVTWKKTERMWLAISRVASVTRDKIVDTCMDRDEAESGRWSCRGWQPDCPFCSADLPHLTVSHLPGIRWRRSD